MHPEAHHRAAPVFGHAIEPGGRLVAVPQRGMDADVRTRETRLSGAGSQLASLEAALIS